MGQLPPGPAASPWMQAYYARGWNTKLARGNALRAALSGPRIIGRALHFRALGQDDSIDTSGDYGFSTSLTPPDNTIDAGTLIGVLPAGSPLTPSVTDTYSTTLPNATFNSTPTGLADSVTAAPGTITGRATNAAGQSVPLIVNAQGISTPNGVASAPASSSLLPWILGAGAVLLILAARNR